METVLRVFAAGDKSGSGKIVKPKITAVLKQIDPVTFNDTFISALFGDGNEGLVDLTGFTSWVTGKSESKDFVESPELQDDLEDLDMDTSVVDDMLNKALDKFKELDANGNGELDMTELKALCMWTFQQFGRSFKNDAEKNKAMDKQIKRYKKIGDTWDFDTFESYYLKQMTDIEVYQVKRSEAFEKGYNKSAAAKKFKELDVDGSGFLDGAEVEVFAEWIFSSFHPDGKPLTEEQKKAESKKLLQRLDAKKGNSDGKLSFVEVDFFIDEKIQQIETFKKKAAEREEKQKKKEAEKKAAKEAKAAKKKPEANAMAGLAGATLMEKGQAEEAKEKPAEN